MNLVREPDAGNPPVRFDEREVETEHGRRLLRHKRGNPETEVIRSLPHRATSRLYPDSSPDSAPDSGFIGPPTDPGYFLPESAICRLAWSSLRLQSLR
jgi:hypothetical protein